MAARFRSMITRVLESEWAVAYRGRKSENLFGSEKQSFQLLKNTMRYWCADPFLVESESKTYVFFEAFDRIKRKGVIGYREIGDQKPGRIHIVLEEPFHLSYPFIYWENKEWYLIPETKDAKRIIRYHASKFPEVWEMEAVIIDNIEAVDTTVLKLAEDDGQVNLITYLWKSFNQGEMQVIQITENQPRILYRQKDSDGRKRPAGKVFMMEDAYYRPSQQCTKTYGEALILNRISFTENSYREEECKVITVDDLHLNRPVKISGVHTYNQSDNWEVIDVEIRGFSLIRTVGLTTRIFHKLKRRMECDRFNETEHCSRCL